MSKISKPLIYGGVGLIAVVAVVMSGNKPDGGSSAQKGKRPTSSRGVSKALEQFDDADFNTVFERLNESPNNAFNPIVVREGSGSSGGLKPNELPASFASGESGWKYTGTVEIDGVPSALMENDLTGDGMFLKVGEKLKKTTIMKIAPTYIVLEANTGRSVQLDLLRDLPDPDDYYDGLEIEPVRPNVGDALSGPIRSIGETGNGDPETSEQ